jgi:ADP-ribose pyrophosphatase YjhB (NUDIX family)
MTPPFIRIRVAAIIVEKGRVLLEKHAKDGREYWVLPGGGVDPGETLSCGLQRELLEEIGVETKAGDLVFACEAIAPDASRHIVQLAFLASITEGTPRVTGYDQRVAEVAWIPVEDVAALEMYPAIQDHLAATLRAGIPNRADSLGNVWK